MAIKKGFILHLPILVAIAILLLVIYIVSRTESSPVAKATQWVSAQIEGFGMPILSTPKCPTGYKFFNDEKGESFCCAGEINPYSHKCLAKGKNAVCSFKPTNNMPLCSALIKNTHSSAENNFCPERLSNYASIGKCCYNHADLDGYNCTKEDNEDMNRYCKITGPLKPGEQLCSALRMSETAVCPNGLSKMSYTLGQQEINKYGNAAKDVTIPICFSMEQSCIPDTVIAAVQKDGIYGDKKDLPAWKYSCSGWDKLVVKRDLTGNMDNTYV